MPAGALREKVTFQRQAVGAGDGMGNLLDDFADIPDAIGIHAQLTPLRHGEAVLAEGIQGRRVFRVIVRYTNVLAGITVNDRMVDARSGALFNIKAPPVNYDRKRKYLDILVEQGGASG